MERSRSLTHRSIKKFFWASTWNPLLFFINRAQCSTTPLESGEGVNLPKARRWRVHTFLSRSSFNSQASSSRPRSSTVAPTAVGRCKLDPGLRNCLVSKVQPNEEKLLKLAPLHCGAFEAFDLKIKGEPVVRAGSTLSLSLSLSLSPSRQPSNIHQWTRLSLF